MKKILLIILSIVLALGMGAAGFYLGSRFDWLELNENYPSCDTETKKDKDKEDNENKEDKKDSNEMKIVSLTDSLVKEASKFMTHSLCGGSTYRFDKKDTKVTDLTDVEKMNIVISLFYDDILDTIADESTLVIPAVSLKRYFDDLSFLNSFKNGMDSATSQGFSLDYPMNVKYKDNKLYITGYATGCEGAYDIDYTKLLSAERNNDKLVLKFHYSFIESDYNENTNEFSYVLYKNYGDKTPVDKNLKYDNKKNDFVIDYSKFDTYEYVFDIKNDKLLLKEINFKAVSNE